MTRSAPDSGAPPAGGSCSSARSSRPSRPRWRPCRSGGSSPGCSTTRPGPTCSPRGSRAPGCPTWPGRWRTAPPGRSFPLASSRPWRSRSSSDRLSPGPCSPRPALRQPLHFRALLTGAGRFYGRMFRTVLVAAIPLGLFALGAAAVSKGAEAAVAEGGDRGRGRLGAALVAPRRHGSPLRGPPHARRRSRPDGRSAGAAQRAQGLVLRDLARAAPPRPCRRDRTGERARRAGPGARGDGVPGAAPGRPALGGGRGGPPRPGRRHGRSGGAGRCGSAGSSGSPATTGRRGSRGSAAARWILGQQILRREVGRRLRGVPGDVHVTPSRGSGHFVPFSTAFGKVM